MTQHSLTFLARGRAIWPACLAFVLIGALSLPLAGCGGDAGPTAPADLVAPEFEGYIAQVEPIDPAGDALLAVTAPGYGRWMFGADSATLIVNVMPNDPIQFFWRAGDAAGLNNVESFRYGWNVNDPDDPRDPGWFSPPTAGYKAQQTQPRLVWSGVERLTIERWDGPRLLVRATIEVWGQPMEPDAAH